MPKFPKNGSLADFQRFIHKVYAMPDARLYSLEDLLTHQQRFAMRAIKGIRKGKKIKIEFNLIIALAWLMAIANRLYVDLETRVWERFPNLCSYCGERTCVCKVMKVKKRIKIKPRRSQKPKSVAEFQAMFENIYPSNTRTLDHAGIHMAEEVGEISEAVHNFMGEHKGAQFSDIEFEMADLVSCIMGVANSAHIDIASTLSKMFSNGCHVCHKAPCTCRFSEVANIKT
ncbi:MAG: hypothetical protein HYS87_02895 [Candidatus Colwellbacteria bacterium]|nr:hypothetical protein [Candidatus Colwellbacteria bacterium]